MADDVVDLQAARWEKNTLPDAHTPREALEAALRTLVDWQPDHCIVLFGKVREDGTTGVHFAQAGSFNNFAQTGLLRHAERLLSE